MNDRLKPFKDNCPFKDYIAMYSWIDPREDDLKEDSPIWIYLLQTAFFENRAAYIVLQDIRHYGSIFSIGTREEGLKFHFPTKNSNNEGGGVYLIRANLWFIQKQKIFIYKIGMSTNVTERIKTLQSILPFSKITLIWHKKFNNYCKVENYLHKKFNDKKIAGEWFNLLEEDIIFIKNKYKIIHKIPYDINEKIRKEAQKHKEYLRNLFKRTWSFFKEESKNEELFVNR